MSPLTWPSSEFVDSYIQGVSKKITSLTIDPIVLPIVNG